MDVRVERTRRSLQQALVELARERPLEEITISDIVGRADVNRSSFYQHYSDKETLLADALDAAAEDAGALILDVEAESAEPPEALVTYLQHLEHNVDLYRRVFGPHGSAVAEARLRARIELIVRDGVTHSGTSVFEGLPLDVVGAGIAGSALGVVQAWIARDPLPPAETAAQWMWRVIVGPGGPWVA